VKAIVSGALAVKPGNGGNAWSRLSWTEGLRRLGTEVCFVEQIDGLRAEQLDWFRSVTERFGLDGAAWLVAADGAVLHGPGHEELLDAAASADVLLNIGGHLTVPELFARPRRRVYLDDDPGFTQFWHGTRNGGARLEGHDLFFTFGANIGRPECGIPAGGADWRVTRPPIVLDDWPVATAAEHHRFTTIATWRGPYGRVEVNGHVYGLKLDEFRKFAELPTQASQRFELALDIHPNETPDLELLAATGWKLVDPRAVASTPEAFRSYVGGSGAEFSVAQGIYVETGSGWFSDRSVRYLASGKPVLVQDTGFGRELPVGEGLLSFSTLNEAVAGAARIAADYEAHCRSARALAEEWFDSDRVVGALLEDALP
jgi:hypothetical protein